MQKLDIEKKMFEKARKIIEQNNADESCLARCKHIMFMQKYSISPRTLKVGLN